MSVVSRPSDVQPLIEGAVDNNLGNIPPVTLGPSITAYWGGSPSQIELVKYEEGTGSSTQLFK